MLRAGLPLVQQIQAALELEAHTLCDLEGLLLLWGPLGYYPPLNLAHSVDYYLRSSPLTFGTVYFGLDPVYSGRKIHCSCFMLFVAILCGYILNCTQYTRQVAAPLLANL